MKNKEIVYKDVVFTYGFSLSSNSRYPMVLTMNIIDPSTGKRMVKEVKNQIPLLDGQIKAKEIRKQIYLPKECDINNKSIEITVRKCAQKLYEDNAKELLRKLSMKPDVTNINSNQMYIRYIEDFMKTQKKASPATQKEKRRILKNACMVLTDKPVAKLSTKDIDVAANPV